MEVRVWEEDMVFPTYAVGAPDPLPMYLEKRVYQGSSGKVYPWPVIDQVADTKTDQVWRVVVLENEWLRIWILPALGGRIHRAFDKTNQYDFVYYNRVVKPALVGLAGPWISGGIEFNWPQHHRPSTYSPVEHCLRHHEDGSKSVVVSEVDRMFGTKGEAEFTLRPDRAVLEIRGRLYNPTPFPQTFLWWANPAVAVNDHTQSVFPPDVTAVMDHGKRDTSRFPIATGTYYKTDYSAGVDISRYRNIPVPTSYMAWKSDYDFVGGYDHDKQAGLLHVADHRVSPGKKQWTWGHGEFGRAWDRHLTDDDGPYIELMTGVFTDNQPDFTWLAPQEEKTFLQNFLPYKQIGEVKNASSEAAVHLSADGGTVRAGVYVTGPRKGLGIEVRGADRVWLAARTDLGPERAWTGEAPCSEAEDRLTIEVRDSAGVLLLAWTPRKAEAEPLPDPAQPIGAPEDLPDAEALWLAGQHLEQYRHATFDPEDYYREGLRRAPRDLRLNGALGLLLLRRGLYADAEALLRKGLQTLTRHNGTPADGELSFHWGSALAALGRRKEAEDAWAKAAWSGAWQAPGFLELAREAARRGDWAEAERQARQSVVRNGHGLAARHLLAVVLRKTGRPEEAGELAEETLGFDPLDFGALREAVLAGRRLRAELVAALRDDARNILLLAEPYAAAGLAGEALACTDEHPAPQDAMAAYHRAAWLEALGRPQDAHAERLRAGTLGPDLVFPSRLVDLEVLEQSLARDPADGRAWLYAGNLLYDRRRSGEAAEAWRRAVEAEPDLSTAWRNLAVVRFNRLGQPEAAREALAEAVRRRPEAPRLRFELDQLDRRLGVDPERRLAALEARADLVGRRDDLSVEYTALLNLTGRSGEALDHLLSRRFHVWEGGEGKVVRQYVRALIGEAVQEWSQGRFTDALVLLKRGWDLPESLGEARLPGAKESQLRYFLGVAAALAGREDEATEWWTEAAQGQDQPTGAMFYNDTPPELIFYQGLARARLGDQNGASERFHALVDFGKRHRFDRVKIDYFAVSLPDFALFEDDLGRRNQIHCRFLTGLGLWGLGDRTRAKTEWAEALILDPSHPGLADHLRWADQGVLDR